MTDSIIVCREIISIDEIRNKVYQFIATIQCFVKLLSNLSINYAVKIDNPTLYYKILCSDSNADMSRFSSFHQVDILLMDILLTSILTESNEKNVCLIMSVLHILLLENRNENLPGLLLKVLEEKISIGNWAPNVLILAFELVSQVILFHHLVPKERCRKFIFSLAKFIDSHIQSDLKDTSMENLLCRSLRLIVCLLETFFNADYDLDILEAVLNIFATAFEKGRKASFNVGNSKHFLMSRFSKVSVVRSF